MIEIDQRLAKQLRGVAKRLFGKMQTLCLVEAGSFGLRLRTVCDGNAIEYLDPRPRDPGDLVVPSQVFTDSAANTARPLTLDSHTAGVVSARWQEGAFEHHKTYTYPDGDLPAFPVAPTNFLENKPDLLLALQEASAIALTSNSRYALSCIQVAGCDGKLIATDGRQLLAQGGYYFGFDDAILFPASQVFGSPELPRDTNVFIGKSESHFVMRAGLWTIYSQIVTDARFPRVADVIPQVSAATTIWELHPIDSQFLAMHISKLPCGACNQSVTLELNGGVTVRGKGEDSGPAEIVLRNSRTTGTELRLATDRNFLARAARLGFATVYLSKPDSAVLAQDENRSYVWMPLANDQIVLSVGNCSRNESPLASETASHSRQRQPSPTSTKVTMAIPQNSNSELPPSKTRKPRKPRTSNTAGKLQQMTAIRDQLRTSLASVKELIRILKAEERGRKSLQSALKQLQAA